MPAFNRRQFIQSTLPVAAALAPGIRATVSATGSRPATSYKLKLSCNLYSFNAPLRSGEMSLEEVIAYCAEIGFDAVDPTGYYFSGYPSPPDEAYLYHIKQYAFLRGLDISGTGVRNDFTVPDPQERAASLAHIKEWVHAAAGMDAPVLRVFTGRQTPEGVDRTEVREWIIEGLQAAAAYGERHGVMIVLQNHNEFIKTADEVLYVRERIATPWFGLNVDIGSLPTGDPYEEIAKLAPYAYTWQIKENLNRGGTEEKTDLDKIAQILKDSGYRGYIPIETLGEGDPKIKVRRFLDEVRTAIA